MRLRSCLTAVIALSATMLTTFLVAGAASAAANITITQAGPTDSDPYVLTVVADDANNLQLTSMTAYLSSGATSVTVSNLQYVSGPASAQTWTATAPVPQADLPPGTYTVTVDAVDADESDTGLAAPAPFSFSWTTNVTATATPSVLTYNETTTTISGQVTGDVPGSSYPEPVGLAGVPVYVNLVNGDAGPWDEQIGTTESDGSFSGSVQLPSADGEYTVTVGATATMDAGGTSLATTWEADAVELTGVTVTPQDFTYGANGVATVTGTLDYQDSVTGWQPLAGETIVMDAGPSDVQYITSNAKGQFTWTFTPDTDGTGWSIEAGGGNLLGVAQASGTVFDAVPVSLSSFSATLSPEAEVTAHACAVVSAPGFTAPQSYLDVQYASKPGGPWTYLGRVHLDQSQAPSSCAGSTRSYFSGTVRARLASAYYRVFLPGSTSFQAHGSMSVHLSKYLTRIISVSVSPRSVAHGGRMTVHGRLQQYKDGRWRDFAHQQVLIVVKPKGSKVWYWLRKVKTNSSGYFSSRFVDPVSGDWTAAYDGSRTDFASSGSIHYVTLKGSARQALDLGRAELS